MTDLNPILEDGMISALNGDSDHEDLCERWLIVT
jgi:hypothetical protein